MQVETIERLISEQTWLDRAGDTLQEKVHEVFGAGTRLLRLRDFLHGVWIGHPLHPMLTDVPTGAWTAAVACDLLGIVRPLRGARAGADVSITLGIAGALAAAATGLADWSHTSGSTRRIGLVHAGTNTAALLLYVASLGNRLLGRRGAGVRLSLLGYACMLFGAYLGGELVFRLGVGVDRNAWRAGPRTFVRALQEADMPEGQPVAVTVDGDDVMLVRRAGVMYALGNACSHQGGPLAEGELADGTITCPWHGSIFCIASGAVIHGPAWSPQPRYDVRVRDGWIEIRRARD